MSQPILDPEFWRVRIEDARRLGEFHRSVYEINLSSWRLIENRHREALAKVVGPGDSVLDAGCGYGRLLSLLPESWSGAYLGLDLSPEFVYWAKKTFPDFDFRQADLRDLSFLDDDSYRLGVAVSLRKMVLDNLGGGEWGKIAAELKRVCLRVFILEYEGEEGEGFL